MNNKELGSCQTVKPNVLDGQDMCYAWNKQEEPRKFSLPISYKYNQAEDQEAGR